MFHKNITTFRCASHTPYTQMLRCHHNSVYSIQSTSHVFPSLPVAQRHSFKFQMASIMSGLRDMVAGGTASSGQPAKLQSTAACAGLGPEAEVQKRFFEQQSFREKRPETDEKGLSQAQASMRTKPDCGEEGYRGSGKMLGKIALITGGDSGIGRAIAIAYAREGADLCLVYDKNDVDANEVKLLIEAAGRRCLLVKADVSSRANCVAAVQRCVTELGGLTTLVNNAAIQFGAESEEGGLDKAADHIERVMAVNLFSNVYLSAVSERRHSESVCIAAVGKHRYGIGDAIWSTPCMRYLCLAYVTHADHKWGLQEAVKHFKEDTGCAILFVTSVNAYKGEWFFRPVAERASLMCTIGKPHFLSPAGKSRPSPRYRHPCRQVQATLILCRTRAARRCVIGSLRRTLGLPRLVNIRVYD
jgi:NAD(P)-dependent dehydrogenase (short-subunit alcohol dehydrogenase family)